MPPKTYRLYSTKFIHGIREGYGQWRLRLQEYFFTFWWEGWKILGYVKHGYWFEEAQGKKILCYVKDMDPNALFWYNVFVLKCYNIISFEWKIINLKNK